jgi:DNA topoisomerase I
MRSGTAAARSPLDRGQRRRWWRRRGTPKSGFRYEDARGARIRDRDGLERIRKLVIPPAWTDVRISPSPRSRLQAVGLDGTGRMQYLYHEAFSALQSKKKFEKIERFGEYLPELRRITTAHLQLPGLMKQRVLALVVRLINRLYFRVGSERGVRRYRTFGVTTLRNQHLRFTKDGQLLFSFDGKHHVHQRRLLVDETLARCLWELKALRGSTLFKFVGDDGRLHPVRAEDVNEYLKSISASEFSAKDFRTWAGTIVVARELAKLGKAASPREAKRKIAQAIRAAAVELGNTPAVCRSAYLHPSVLSAYLKGYTLRDLSGGEEVIRSVQTGYDPDELALLELFQFSRSRRRPTLAHEPAVPAAELAPLSESDIIPVTGGT